MEEIRHISKEYLEIAAYGCLVAFFLSFLVYLNNLIKTENKKFAIQEAGITNFKIQSIILQGTGVFLILSILYAIFGH